MLAAMALLTPAYGQELGTRIKSYDPAVIPNTIHMPDAERARVTLDGFATCLVEAKPHAIESILKLAVDDPAYDRAVRNISTGDCIESGQLSFPTDLTRGAFYTALYRTRFAHNGRSFGPTPVFSYSDVVANSSDEVKRHAVLTAFADCVVRQDPANSRALVIGPTASGREASAQAALMPVMGPCMPQGYSIHFSKSVLYGVIAEALYRESVAATPAAEIAKVTK